MLIIADDEVIQVGLHHKFQHAACKTNLFKFSYKANIDKSK